MSAITLYYAITAVPLLGVAGIVYAVFWMALHR